ncbi:MAG TPA: hypothetical protein PK411_06590 [Mesotoga infera]|nr:hypothetical protein [Mesotoga sp.]NLI07663.1 hypothetical protein [Thermotogaceae bacterium]HNR80304.1 hypothetical protein [Mesotoga infera]HOI35025.1 hypothetical protein [Mesotoga infera]HPD37998.1 hypothetical protein [Mesotoga infera]
MTGLSTGIIEILNCVIHAPFTNGSKEMTFQAIAARPVVSFTQYFNQSGGQKV